MGTQVFARSCAILLAVLLVAGSVTATGQEPTKTPESDPSGLRSDQASTGNLDALGNSEASEVPVTLALQWLAAHQMPDGGWTFEHHQAPGCGGACRNPGENAARTAATGLALMAMLGASQTHKSGKYRATVKSGLAYLTGHIQIAEGPNAGSMLDSGNMYSHGIAAIALCEAYGMTGDRDMGVSAQKAIDFIVYAQDPVGGGWRYQPRQKGDTSVTGWQFMALMSGQMAGLQVPSATVQKVSAFLDRVQANDGANYGYTDPGAGPATTAIGLLSRMHLGWKRDRPALQKGVQWLSKTGPSKGNLYYNHYATQVMWHWGGDPWKQWNATLRDRLVQSQAREGHEAGSWFLDGDHGSRIGGRLYCTTMAAMILEVYYRHYRIYDQP